MNLKTFSIEFLTFPGIEVKCKLCEELIIPSLYYGEEYEGPICDECYKGLPLKINVSRLPKFEG